MASKILYLICFLGLFTVLRAQLSGGSGGFGNLAEAFAGGGGSSGCGPGLQGAMLTMMTDPCTMKTAHNMMLVAASMQQQQGGGGSSSAAPSFPGIPQGAGVPQFPGIPQGSGAPQVPGIPQVPGMHS